MQSSAPATSPLLPWSLGFLLIEAKRYGDWIMTRYAGCSGTGGDRSARETAELIAIAVSLRRFPVRLKASSTARNMLNAIKLSSLSSGTESV